MELVQWNDTIRTTFMQSPGTLYSNIMKIFFIIIFNLIKYSLNKKKKKRHHKLLSQPQAVYIGPIDLLADPIAPHACCYKKSPKKIFPAVSKQSKSIKLGVGKNFHSRSLSLALSHPLSTPHIRKKMKPLRRGKREKKKRPIAREIKIASINPESFQSNEIISASIGPRARAPQFSFHLPREVAAAARAHVVVVMINDRRESARGPRGGQSVRRSSPY